MRPRHLGAALAATGLLLLAGSATGVLPSVSVVAGVALLFGASNQLGPTRHMADDVRPLIGSTLTAAAWDAPLDVSGSAFELRSVRSVGVGLLLYLQPLGERRPVLLKIAQPETLIADRNGVTVVSAKYIQWRGRKVSKVEGAAALTMHARG